MMQKPKVRVVVRKRSAGNNIVSQCTLPKSFTDAYELDSGDVLWFELEHIKKAKKDENIKSNRG